MSEPERDHPPADEPANETQVSDPTLSTAEGGIDEIVARQERMGQKRPSGQSDDDDPDGELTTHRQ